MFFMGDHPLWKALKEKRVQREKMIWFDLVCVFDERIISSGSLKQEILEHFSLDFKNVLICLGASGFDWKIF